MITQEKIFIGAGKRKAAKGFWGNQFHNPKQSISFDPAMHARISEIAAQQNVSFASIVRQLVKEALKCE